MKGAISGVGYSKSRKVRAFIDPAGNKVGLMKLLPMT